MLFFSATTQYVPTRSSSCTIAQHTTAQLEEMEAHNHHRACIALYTHTKLHTLLVARKDGTTDGSMQTLAEIAGLATDNAPLYRCSTEGLLVTVSGLRHSKPLFPFPPRTGSNLGCRRYSIGTRLLVNIYVVAQDGSYSQVVILDGNMNG